MSPAPLLEVRDLTVLLDRVHPVVSQVSFDVPAGSTVGLFGESGCGKTSLALSLLRLLPEARYRITGSVRFAGTELLSLPERALEKLRGASISLLLQDPLLALNPVLRVRRQVAQVLESHSITGNVEELFSLVGLGDTARIGNSYPHQLSGGERQRVLLAQALACRPALVIADEPFTALDAPRVVELVALFHDLRQRLGTAFLLIGHSPGVLAAAAGHLLVMYAGEIVERGTPRQILDSPLHPYTAGLLQAFAGEGFTPIPGAAPGLEERGEGCRFAPRCARRMERCDSHQPPEYTVEELRQVRCFLYER